MATETLTYAGRRIARNGKLVYTYNHEGSTLSFPKALLPATVGAHIEVEAVEVDGDGHPTKVSNARYGEGRTVGDDMTRYAAMDAAAIGANEAAKRAKGADPLLEALGPIRDAYMIASPIERAALLTKVVRAITTY